MQRLEVSGVVRPLKGSLGIKGLSTPVDNLAAAVLVKLIQV